jgi:hypothetical protein
MVFFFPSEPFFSKEYLTLAAPPPQSCSFSNHCHLVPINLLAEIVPAKVKDRPSLLNRTEILSYFILPFANKHHY